MKKLLPIIILFLWLLISPVYAETKEYSSRAPARVFPKLPKTPDDPVLSNGGVYPMWGPVCQRYTYFTYYSDKEGRPPEYVRMYFNGKWLDVQKENHNDNDYRNGVKYSYKFVPNKIGPNFFFFEASNGLGKTREGIIDSPGNGPVLFDADFLNNEISVVERETEKKILSYPTGREWVGGVALSDDGRWLATKTSFHIYLFDTTKPEQPTWEFLIGGGGGMVGGDVKGGIAISGDGTKIFASAGDSVFLFDKAKNQPIWQYPIGNAYNVAISKDGQYVAAATAGSEDNLNSNLLLLWNVKSSKPLWQYHASGNFHDVTLSGDGSFLAGSTGCPDRRAYIFSKDSNNPLVKSEMLTYDSPISRAKITADGKIAAFNTDGGPKSKLVALFSKDSSQPLWQYDDSLHRSSRALAITPDGEFIAVANMVGDVYLFNKNGGQPLSKWKINATTAAFDMADDGSLIAVGGTDYKVHLLEVTSQKQSEVSFEEFVEEIDVSANGKYIAAGTGGSPYFFEEIVSPNKDKVYTCEKIIEPTPMEQLNAGDDLSGGQGATCGDGKCEAQEIKTCAEDCGQGEISKPMKLPGMIFGFGVLGSVLALGIYLAIIRFNLLKRPPEKLLKINRKIVVLILIFMAIFSALTIWAIVFNKTKSKINLQESEPSMGGEFQQGEKGICGNSLCEPNLGETKDNCPKDCSGGD